MKKISITSQIILLFLFILLLSVSTFSLVTLTRVRIIAKDEMYARLTGYCTVLDRTADLENPGEFKDMNIAYIVKDGDTISYSSQLNNYITKEEITNILDSFTSDSELFLKDEMVNSVNDKIYYVVQKEINKDFVLVLTDASYIDSIVRRISFQTILLFSTISLFSVLAIAAWGVNLVNRIKRIQNQIEDLTNKDIKNKPDNALDEIGELSRSVEEMKIQINETEAVKTEMLQNISHDFKTPIAVIKSYAEAIEDGMVDEDACRIIINQADVLKNKVNRLLQYNSLEYLSKDKEFIDVNMKEVIEEVIQNYKFQTSIEIDLDLDENVYFKGYRENFYTVVDNIIDNAKRYAKTKIKIVLRQNRLRIYNDGQHIGEQFLNSVFKPYEKGDKGQFGLGMSIVKKTVEFFGMQLIVKNEKIGVSFIIIKN